MTPSGGAAPVRRDGGRVARRPGRDPAHAARVLDRVASLAAAGIGHERAWELVIGRDAAFRAMLAAGASPDADRSSLDHESPPPLLRAGDTVVDALAWCGTAWADVAAVLRVATRTGAPAVPALRALADAARSTAESDRAVGVALAAPRASARVVLLLPVVGLLLGSVWGSGAVGTLFGTPFGWGCVAAAGGLVAAGAGWSRRLVTAAEPDGRIPGALLDAWAVAVTAGGSWTDADRAVRTTWTHREQPADERDRVADALGLAIEAGAPVSALLRADAEDVRRDAAAAGIAAAERLGVRLVLPLGLCVLPAFVLVGVVPVVLGVLSSTVGLFG